MTTQMRLKPTLLRVADGIEEIRCNRRFAACEQNVHVTVRFHAARSIEDLPDVFHRELVDVRAVVGVHEAGRAFQIAAVRQIDDQRDAASGPNRRRPVVVNVRVPGAREVMAEVQRFHSLEERGIRREDVLERSVLGACLAHQDSAGLLEDVGVDHAWIAPEIGDVREPVEHGADRVGIATGTERLGSTRDAKRGVDRSWLLGSGAGAHAGVGLFRSGSARDAARERCQPAFAAAESKAEPKTCGRIAHTPFLALGLVWIWLRADHRDHFVLWSLAHAEKACPPPRQRRDDAQSYARDVRVSRCV